MRKYTSHIIVGLTILLVAWGSGAPATEAWNPFTALVQGVTNQFISGMSAGTLVSILSTVSWLAMSVAGWFLSMTGTLLNVAMFLTTHLGLFIDQTPVIYAIWTIIRDLSSLLLIFVILYAAIRMILSKEEASYGNLIKNIIIVGILINFSFFFTRVLIDFSNVVSLQLYNGIAPDNSASVPLGDITDISLVVPKLMTSGGIADILMGALKVTTVWQANGPKSSAFNTTDNVASGIDLLVKTVAGTAVIVITACSFAVAAFAAIWRVVVLLLLLGFSPLWMASSILPQLKTEVAERWTKPFKAQLIFLPVYLIFMYVALKIVTETHLGNMVSAKADSTTGNLINLCVGYTIMIFMLNIPLVAAVQVSGASMKWTEEALKKVRANTVGRVASYTAGSNLAQNIAARAPGGRMALTALRNVAKDYNAGLKKTTEEKTAFGESLGFNQQKVNAAEAKLRRLRADKAAPADIHAQEAVIENLKNARKKAYAKSLDTLWNRAGRSNPKAAAKINVDIWEAQLKEHKDNLKDAKSELKQLENQIQAQYSRGDKPTKEQEVEEYRLEEKIEGLNDILKKANLENKIAAAKLTK